MFLDRKEKMRLIENNEIFEDMFQCVCNSDIIKMVEYVIDSMDSFEDKEIGNQFLIDFYKWCGTINPEMEN
tara:strand:- start:2382 stop:2594 length:213 start_codon:yes stop_codon:yes gene_type:complete